MWLHLTAQNFSANLQICWARNNWIAFGSLLGGVFERQLIYASFKTNSRVVGASRNQSRTHRSSGGTKFTQALKADRFEPHLLWPLARSQDPWDFRVTVQTFLLPTVYGIETCVICWWKSGKILHKETEAQRNFYLCVTLDPDCFEFQFWLCHLLDWTLRQKK
jgi:hypothetical protein